MAGAGRYIIDTNGAEIYDTQDEEQLYSCGLDTDFCMKLYRHVLENNLFIRIDTKYGRYINDMKNVVLDEMPMEEDYKKFFEENVVLQMSIGSEDSRKIDEVVRMLDSRVKEENRFISSLIPVKLDMINIINSSASKGNAILGLCKYLKIKPEEAMAFGDDINDISMMKSVHGVAMGNAGDSIKALAKEITKTNDEAGIAEILNRIVEEKRNA
jgi:hypothetical protein